MITDGLTNSISEYLNILINKTTCRMEEILAKVIMNKRNKQLLIHLSKKKLELMKNKNPKFIRIRKEDILY